VSTPVGEEPACPWETRDRMGWWRSKCYLKEQQKCSLREPAIELEKTRIEVKTTPSK